MIRAHLKASLIEISRLPGFLVPTTLFPTMLFLFFGAPAAATTEAANFLTASFAVYGVMGVAFYQFGVGIAEDQQSPWEEFLRTLPVTVTQRFIARLASALVIAALTSLILLVAAALFSRMSVPPQRWPGFMLALLAGGTPFALFGIALGYTVPPKGAVPIANLLYLPLAFAGGIWIPPTLLPAAVQEISPWLPSRIAGELAWAAIAGQPWRIPDVIGIIVYTALAYGLARLAYARHRQRRFG